MQRHLIEAPGSNLRVAGILVVKSSSAIAGEDREYLRCLGKRAERHGRLLEGLRLRGVDG